MPPYCDIYGFSKKRDRETIERFLDHFADRDLIENCTGQEIGVHGSEKYGIAESITPISTLTEVIEFGVEHPHLGFAFYIGDRLKNVKHIILKFTFDGNIIFGISVEEKNGEYDQLSDNYKRAFEVSQEIAKLTSSSKTFVSVEYPPADDEEEFDADLELNRDFNEEQQSLFIQ